MKARPAAWTALAVAEAFAKDAIDAATNAALLADAAFSWLCPKVAP